MPRHGWLVLAFVAACNTYRGDAVTLLSLTQAPRELGPIPTAFADTVALPAHGPTNELVVYLPTAYTPQFVDTPPSRVIFKGPDSVPVILQASLVLTDGTRRLLAASGYRMGLAGHRYGVVLSEQLNATDTAHARSIEITANVPVRTEMITWWSGDEAKLPVLP